MAGTQPIPPAMLSARCLQASAITVWSSCLFVRKRLNAERADAVSDHSQLPSRRSRSVLLLTIDAYDISSFLYPFARSSAAILIVLSPAFSALPEPGWRNWQEHKEVCCTGPAPQFVPNPQPVIQRCNVTNDSSPDQLNCAGRLPGLKISAASSCLLTKRTRAAYFRSRGLITSQGPLKNQGASTKSTCPNL